MSAFLIWHVYLFIYLFLEQINTDDNVTAIVVLWSRFLNFWDKQSTYHLDYKLLIKSLDHLIFVN